MCPDYKKPINKRPPFQFKCTGMKITEEGEQAFNNEVWRLIQERN